MHQAHRLRCLLAILCLPLALSACSTLCERSAAGALVEVATELEVKNPSAPEAGLLCAGMLSEEQFRQLADEGYETFISLRLPSEKGTGWEPAVAADLGVTFINLPIKGGAGITEANARALATLLADTERPIALYCGSSNRVGSLYGLAKFYVDGLAPQAALEVARGAGMRSLEPRVRELLGLPEAE